MSQRTPLTHVLDRLLHRPHGWWWWTGLVMIILAPGIWFDWNVKSSACSHICVVVAAAVVCGLVQFGKHFRRAEWKRGMCPMCAYDVSAVERCEICPECGYNAKKDSGMEG